MLVWNGNVNVSVETNLIQDSFGAGRISAMIGAQVTQIKTVEALMQSVFGVHHQLFYLASAFTIFQVLGEFLKMAIQLMVWKI